MYPYLVLGPITISTYFLIISLASTFGAIWFLKRAGDRDLSRVMAIDLTLVCLASGFAGARLLHVLFEDPAYYQGAPRHILEVWNGGFVFLGGFLGAALGGYIFCLVRKEPFLLLADLAIMPLSMAYAIGRLACFMNGCCYGRHCDLPWAIFMNGERRHPTQLYASFWEFGVLALLAASQSRLKEPGRLLGLWMILHSVGRIIMEYFRDDPRGESLSGMSLATWISGLLLIAGTILLWPKGREVAPEMQS